MLTRVIHRTFDAQVLCDGEHHTQVFSCGTRLYDGVCHCSTRVEQPKPVTRDVLDRLSDVDLVGLLLLADHQSFLRDGELDRGATTAYLRCVLKGTVR